VILEESQTMRNGCKQIIRPFLAMTILVGMSLSLQGQNCFVNLNASATAMCPGDSIQLIASASTGTILTWSHNGIPIPSVGSTMWVKQGGSYIVNASDGASCSAFAGIAINVVPLPPIAYSITGSGISDSTDANGNITYYKCNGNGQFKYDITTSASDYSSWFIDYGDGFTTGSVGSFINVINHFYANGWYQATITLTNSLGCDTSLVFYIHQANTPQVSLTPIGSLARCRSSSGVDTVWYSVGNFSSNADSTTYELSFNNGSANTIYNHPPPSMVYAIMDTGTCALSSNALVGVMTATGQFCGSDSDIADDVLLTDKSTAIIDGLSVFCLAATTQYADSSVFANTAQLVNGSVSCAGSPKRVWTLSPNTFILSSGLLGNFSSNTSDPSTWTSGSQALDVQFTQAGTYTLILYQGLELGGTTCGITSDTLSIVVHPVQFDSLQSFGCDSTFANGQWYYQSTSLTDSATSSTGCDSITFHEIVVYPSFIDSTSNTSCGPTTWQGQNLLTSGMYHDSLTSVNGCDSVLFMAFNRLYTSGDTVTLSGCDSLIYQSHTFTSSGQTWDSLTAVNGCDSLVLFDVSIVSSYQLTQQISDCQSYSINGNTYTTSGTFIDSLLSAAGCDSIVTTLLTIHGSTVDSTWVTACDQYIFHGSILTSTAVYSQMLQSVNGCDSNQVLSLTINNSDSTWQTLSGCYMVSYQGIDHFSSTNFSLWLTNARGCDSTHHVIIDVMPGPQLLPFSPVELCLSDPIHTLSGASPLGGSYFGPFVVNGQFHTPSAAIGSHAIGYVYTSSSGCVDTVFSWVDVIGYCEPQVYVPNAFTPNGDVVNDFFKVYAQGVDSFHVTIYSRWGNVLYESDSPGFRWDGRSNGQMMPIGAYTYRINYSYTKHGLTLNEELVGVLQLLQ
jgi:gliding motility-associated-like protein